MIDWSYTKTIRNDNSVDTNRCGLGYMLVLGTSGDVLPCSRWLINSVIQTNEDSKKKYHIGNVSEGLIQKNNLKRIRELTPRKISLPECLNCNHESVCEYCVTNHYSENEEFKRTTHLCEIIKLQCKAASLYWKKIMSLNDSNDYIPNHIMDRCAADNKHFLRKSDGIIFGSNIRLSKDDDIDNYIQVDIPPYDMNKFIPDNILLFNIVDDTYRFEINLYNRKNKDTYCFEQNGPQGNFPIGRWVSITSNTLHEELIITDKFFTALSDIFGKSEYLYKLEDNKFYLYQIDEKKYQ
jgi:radical SAM protein with 4Fe4S-binding SPASM domain